MTTKSDRRTALREVVEELTPPGWLARVPGHVLHDRRGALVAWLAAEGLPPVNGLELSAERLRRRRVRHGYRIAARDAARRAADLTGDPKATAVAG